MSSAVQPELLIPPWRPRSVISPSAKKVLKAEDLVDQTAPPVFQRTGRLAASAETARVVRDAAARTPAARRVNTVIEDVDII